MDASTQAVEPVSAAETTNQNSEAPSQEAPLTKADRLKAYLEARQRATNAEGEGEADAASESPEGEAAQEAKTEEAKAKDNLKVAQLKRENTRLTTELVEAKKRLEELHEVRQKAKKNPIRAMEELFGEPFPKIIERAARREFDDHLESLPPEIREKLAYVEKLQKEAEERAREEQRKGQRAEDLPRVKDFLAAKADELPFFAAVEGSAEQLLDLAYEYIERTRKQPDLMELAAEQERLTLDNFERFLCNDAFVKTLLSKSEKVRTSLSKHLKSSEPKTSPLSDEGRQGTRNGPRNTLSNSLTQEVQSRTQNARKTRKELLEEYQRARGMI